MCVCVHLCKANLFPMNKIIYNNISTGMHAEVQNKGVGLVESTSYSQLNIDIHTLKQKRGNRHPARAGKIVEPGWFTWQL